MKILFTFLFIFSIFSIYSQDYKYKNYEWESSPKAFIPNEKEKSESYIVLKDQQSYEYVLTEPNNDIFIYYLKHQKIWVNDDKAIELFNTSYIPMYGVVEAVKIKARAITSTGKAIEIDDSNIKDIANYENYGAFKLFAIKGIEKNCVIEILYILKKQPTSYYGSFTYQKDGIVKNVKTEIISPKHLIFRYKGYNGLDKITDTIIDEKHYIIANIDSVPVLQKETYASYYSNLTRFEYIFDYNSNNQKTSFYTWAYAAQKEYEYISKDVSADKLVQKAINKLKINEKSEEDKIITIENYIKNNFILSENNIPSDLAETFSSKTISKYGFVKLFVKFLESANIDFQTVITTDRTDLVFDKDFMTYSYLNEYLIYFPNTDKYLYPSDKRYKYGIFPSGLGDNYGLFLKTLKIGDVKTALHEIKFIVNPGGIVNYNNLYLDVKINDAFDNTNIYMKHSFSGQTGMFIQPDYLIYTEEEKNEFLDLMIKSISKDAVITTKKALNTNPDTSLYFKPFIIESDFSTKSVIEQAGNNYLFKVGTLIGEQSELYNKDERKLNMDVEYPHKYYREIKINIPDGYKVSGLENLKINIDFNNNIGFVSDYEVKDNYIIVKINEYYNSTQYPLSFYENFRKVINAAADFNKIVLIFEKK